MSVKIRFARTGKKHNINYRIVAQDTHSKRDGRFLEILGNVEPKGKDRTNFNIVKARYEFWLSKGARPTPAVSQLISNGKPKTEV